MTQEASATKAEMAEEFKFLQCERCQEDVKTPTLLPCLHNLCTTCLEENKPIGLCPICGTAHSQDAAGLPHMQENLLFVNLQAKLSIYQKVVGGKEVICDNCKNVGTYWCSDCEEFMCTPCFESHQRYLKRESHEAKPLKDLQTESCPEFLAGIRKLNVMFCSKKDHKTHTLSIYCNECRQSMCCVCALLDSKHSGQHCDIRTEIQCRQEELRNMSVELKEKKSNYDTTYHSVLELVGSMEKTRNEMKEQIQQKIDAMVRMLQKKGERFLEEVEDQHKQQVQEVKKTLQDMEGVVKRMESSEQLVEKMNLYATDQEMLEMHPFIRKSLEELKKQQLPTVHCQIPVEKFEEINTQLQALLERVMNDNEAVPARLKTQHNQVDRTRNTNGEVGNQRCRVAIKKNASNTADHVAKSPAKRKRAQEERSVQTLPKVAKAEPDDSEYIGAGGTNSLEQPGTSFQSSGADRAKGSGGKRAENIANSSCLPSSSSEASDPDDLTLVDISSEEEVTDDDSVASNLLKEVNSRILSIQKRLMRQPSSNDQEPDASQGTMVFFDLKILTGSILHLVAVADETNCFSVMIQPLLSSPISNMTSSLCEIGLDKLLNYLQSLRRAILVGFNLWSMELPSLVEALRNINQEERFEKSILGFLDALPLIQEKCPNVPSCTLKNLDREYFWGQLDDTRAADCAKTLKDLCTVLEINPVTERKPVIAYSSLQCYTSLQPLLGKKFLTKASVQTLALHNVSLSMLESV